jgi:phosphoribosyl 1,2-cyclic phosphate phosphodiesterase
MDDVRAFNYKQKSAMEVFATEATQESLRREFYYIFSDFKYPGIPLINFNTIALDRFTVGDITLQPIEVFHYKMPVLGFRVKDFTYITDAKTITDTEFEKIKGTKILVINALQIEKHISHFTLEEAIAFAKKVNAEQTYFTHISHKLGKHKDVSEELGSNIALSFDGLSFDI